jgi:hypothetical protein
MRCRKALCIACMALKKPNPPHLRPQSPAVLNRLNRQNWMRDDVFRYHYPSQGLMTRSFVVMIQTLRQDSLDCKGGASIIK